MKSRDYTVILIKQDSFVLVPIDDLDDLSIKDLLQQGYKIDGNSIAVPMKIWLVKLRKYLENL